MSRTSQQDAKRYAERWVKNNINYEMCFYKDFDYSILQHLPYVIRKGNGDKNTWNDVIIMLDTETSKTDETIINLAGDKVNNRNIVVMFTLTIRCCNKNLVTLWGTRPSECIAMLSQILRELRGDMTPIYIHNLSYDWVFLRKFLIKKFGHPVKQLNVKSHYPIYIEFENGLILRDSLILSQRSLEKWAIDMDVEHKKAVGYWDYDKRRNQDYIYSDNELHYAEFDTLAGVECLQKVKDMLHKQIYAMPWTATGIPREECRKRGREVHARDIFEKQAPETLELYQLMERVYHGGYTHANRYIVGRLIE